MKAKGPIYLMIISGIMVVAGTILRFKQWPYGSMIYYAGLIGAGLALALVFGRRK